MAAQKLVDYRPISNEGDVQHGAIAMRTDYETA